MSRRNKTRKPKSRKPGRARKPAASPRQTPKRMDLTAEEFEGILERAKTSALSQEDREKLKATVDSLARLTGELKKKNTSLARLRQLVGLTTSERIRQVLQAQRAESSDGQEDGDGPEDGEGPEDGGRQERADAD